jgi:hypothetical protein
MKKRSFYFLIKIDLNIETIVYICIPIIERYNRILIAGVVELVDTLDLGSSAERCGSSSLPARTLRRKASWKQEAFF